MNYRNVWISIILLALVSMGCRITLDLPISEITPGPVQTMEIEVPAPDASEVDLKLAFGAGELKLTPGAERALVRGTATFNVEYLKPEIETQGDDVLIKTGDFDVSGYPNFKGELKNIWDLSLSDLPMNLTINAGAYQGEIELGGLALKSLQIADGASEVEIRFSEPNLVEMSSLRYSTGASKVQLYNLANANFSSMFFRSGAGDYLLDFTGTIKRDAVVTIESGISQVVVIVPKEMNARVMIQGGLTNISVLGNWEKTGNEYILEGSGPLLIINVDMAAGSFEIRAE